MSDNYDDIIHLPRHISKTRPKMAIIDRAAQFAPFAALTGYDSAIQETARLTDKKIELDQSQKDLVSKRLQILATLEGQPEIVVTYFQPDTKKQGGTYLTVIGVAKKIDEYNRTITMAEGNIIPIDDIASIEGELFDTY